MPLCFEEREIPPVLLPFVSQHALHLSCNTPPISIAVLLQNSWWLWSPRCSQTVKLTNLQHLNSLLAEDGQLDSGTQCKLQRAVIVGVLQEGPTKCQAMSLNEAWCCQVPFRRFHMYLSTMSHFHNLCQRDVCVCARECVCVCFVESLCLLLS